MTTQNESGVSHTGSNYQKRIMYLKILKIAAIVLTLILLGIQFVRPNFTNPPVTAGERIEDVLKVPNEVDFVLKRSCADCHSNETRYPWYSKVAPLSWGMDDHIRIGREELNFSVWKTYSNNRQVRKLKEMCDEVENGAMPHYQYLWIHRDAVLSGQEKNALCSWTKIAAETVPTDDK